MASTGERQRLGYQPALDGIRALSFIAVLLSHLAIPYMRGGGYGVLVFFVLSGYLITTLLLQERDATAAIDLLGFYLRRGLRLLPGLVLVMVATIVLLPIHVGGSATVRAIIPALLYFANWMWFFQGTDFQVLGYFGHFWSLSVEEQFYLLWPIALIMLARRCRERTLAAGLAVVCVGVLTVRVATIHGPSTAHLLFGTHAIMDQLAFGALLALLLRRDGAFVASLKMWGWRAAVVLGVVILAVRPEAAGLHGVLSNTVGPTAAGAATAVVIGHVVTSPGGRMARSLACGPLVFLGRISYGLYLWHVLVTTVLGRTLAPGPTAWVGTFVVTVVVASASFYLWERPFLRFKNMRKTPALTEAEAETAR